MSMIEVPITKAGKSVTITVDTDHLSTDVYEAVMREGLKVCLNAKMTTVGPVTKLEKEGRLDELAKENSAAMTIAQKNLAALTDGTFKFSGSKAKSTESREVTNEAMRIARDVIRDQLRAANITISHVAAKDITAAAKALVERDESYIAKAKDSLAKRKEVPTDLIDLSALGLHADPAKVAKAEAAKETRKQNLSAAQAGKVKGRSKPKADPATVIAAAVAGGKAPAHTHH